MTSSARSSPNDGIACSSPVSVNAPQRPIRVAYGRNAVDKPPCPSFLKLAWQALHDPMLVALCTAGTVSMGIGLYRDLSKGVKAVASPFANVLTAIQDGLRVLPFFSQSLPLPLWTRGITGERSPALRVNRSWLRADLIIVVIVQERQFRQMDDDKDRTFTLVMRSGETVQVDSSDVNVGDIVILRSGSLVPADGKRALGISVPILF